MPHASAVEMNKEVARITFLIEPGLKKRFEELCTARDITLSQALRQFVKWELSSSGAKRTPAMGRESKK